MAHDIETSLLRDSAAKVVLRASQSIFQTVDLMKEQIEIIQMIACIVQQLVFPEEPVLECGGLGAS